MDDTRTEPAHRAISMIALLQVGVVTGGTLFVNTVLEAHGYEFSKGFGEPFRDEAVFIRHYGLTLLLIPVLWSAWAIYAGKVLESPDLRRVVLGIGAVLVVFGFGFYLVTGFQALRPSVNSYEPHFFKIID